MENQLSCSEWHLFVSVWGYFSKTGSSFMSCSMAAGVITTLTLRILFWGKQNEIAFSFIVPKCYRSYFKGHKIIIHIRRQKHLDKIASSTLQDLLKVVFLFCTGLFDIRSSPVCNERGALRPVLDQIVALLSSQNLNLNKCTTQFSFGSLEHKQ